jgi:UDP-GlcNAc:undecaprenyl-phosphate GlcNAc-1-phosphate transferase
MAGQLVAALLAWMGGIQIHLFHGFSLDVWISLPVTVIWLLICANAFNLIDGLDGLAAGAGLFATVTILAAALLDHNLSLVLLTVPLLGCLLGFLRYNFNPASVFLGDCGSLTIGFLLGCFGVLWSQKISTFIGLSAPLMAMSLPLVDTSLAVARRFLRNRPIFSGDRGHIHHRLLDRGNSPKQTAVLLYLVSGGAALFSLAQQSLHRQFGAVVVLIFCSAIWAGVHYLGYLEFGFARRFFATGTLFRLIDDQIRLHSLETSLRSAKGEEEAFDLISRTCNELGFTQVLVAKATLDDYAMVPTQSSCQVSIPFGSGRMLVLGGLVGTGRPLALPQLAALLSNNQHQRIWQKQTSTEALDLALLETFGAVANVPVAHP